MELNSIRVVQGAALPQPGSAEAESQARLAEARETRAFQDVVLPGAGVVDPRAVAGMPRSASGRSAPGAARGNEEGAAREEHVVEVGGFLLSFRIEKDGGRPVAELLDPDTRQVIREIPSEELRELAAALAEYSGNFIDREG